MAPPDLMDDLERFALELPGAWPDSPWDDRVVKVGKKIFLFLGSPESPGMSVKLPESLDHALSLPGAAPTGYGLGRHGWVSIAFDGLGSDEEEVLADFVEESYRAVAPKQLVKELDAAIAATENPAD